LGLPRQQSSGRQRLKNSSMTPRRYRAFGDLPVYARTDSPISVADPLLRSVGPTD